jgi:hypothetical protein
MQLARLHEPVWAGPVPNALCPMPYALMPYEFMEIMDFARFSGRIG